MKLKNRIILGTIIISIISIVFIAFINYNISIKRLEEEINSRTQSDAINIVKDIDKWMALQKDSLFEVAECLVVGNNFDREFVNYYLNRAIERNPGNSYYMSFTDKTYYDGEGWVPESSYDPTSREWYIEAINNEDFYISEPYVDAMTKEMIVTISKSFITREDRKFVISTDIKINYLINLIDSANIVEDSYAFLIDDRGNILTHLNDEFKPTESKYVRIDEILDGNLNTLAESKNLNLEDRKYKDYDGIERFFFFGNIEESGWKVGVVIPTDSVMKTVKNTVFYSLIAAGVALIGAIVISSLISNSILKPIKDLNYLIEKVSYFNLTDDKLYSKLARNKSEIGDMVENISQMRKNLNEILRTTKASSKMLLESSEVISQNTNNSAAMIEEVSKATEELASGAYMQAKESSQGFDKLNALSDGFRYIVRGCQVLEKHGEDTLKVNKKNLEVTNKLKSSINNEIDLGINEDLEKSIKAFEEISHSIDDQFKLIKSLMGTIEDANIYREEALSAIEAIASIAQESSASTEEVSAAMEEQTASITELALMSDKFKQIALKLDKEIERFTLE